MAVKLVSRATKRFAALDAIKREYADYEIDLVIRFAPASRTQGECYYAVDETGETLGQFELCRECGESWLCAPGCAYDEEHCVCCGRV